MHIIRVFLVMLCLIAQMAHASDVPESIVSYAKTTCSSQVLQKQAINQLPADLANLRKKIAVLETRQSETMSLKGEVLRRKGKWSDDNDQRLFKALIASDAYQSFESERAKIIDFYMQTTETFISALMAGDRLADACESSSVMRFNLEWLYIITDEQWKQMLLEKDNALNKLK